MNEDKSQLVLELEERIRQLEARAKHYAVRVTRTSMDELRQYMEYHSYDNLRELLDDLLPELEKRGWLEEERHEQ